MITIASTWKMRVTQNELLAKVGRMKSDIQILIRPETESVRMYHTHAQLVKRAQLELIKELQARGINVHRLIRIEKEARSIARTLAKVAQKKRGLLRAIVRDNNCTETSVVFGLTRQRVHQLKEKMQRYALIKKVDFEQVWADFI